MQSENPLILHFPGLLSKYFLSKLKLLDKIHSKMKIYLEIPPKNGIKVGIHFYENIPSEINLPLPRITIVTAALLSDKTTE